MNSKMTVSEGQFQNVHQDLIDGCRKNDQKSQFKIYKLYYKAMYNTSLRIVNDPMEAEDIMQESFLSAFEKIGCYSGTVSFGAWLKKIVQNRSLDFIRKESRIIYEDIESLPASEVVYIENQCEAEEHDPRINILMNIIQLLPEKYRNIISLYLFEGYDQEEISEILSITGNTARSQFTRAKHMIRREFESAGTGLAF
jgi:RNA polymerase sigma factor (sigma-70 family)